MSLREFGKSVGLPHTTISKAEAGDASETTWIKLAEHFKISPSLILEWAGKQSTEKPDPWAEEMAALVNSLQNPLYREAAQILIEGFVKKEEKERRKQGKQ